MSGIETTLAKSRLYDLGGEIDRQTRQVRETAEAARKLAAEWFEWRGDGFDLMNLESGCGKVAAAVQELSLEIDRLKRLVAETHELKGKL